MSEAVNKQLKYHDLYLHALANHEALRRHLTNSIPERDNRPMNVLHGLTPREVRNGQRYNHDQLQLQIDTSRIARIAANKKAICCHNF